MAINFISLLYLCYHFPPLQQIFKQKKEKKRRRANQLWMWFLSFRPRICLGHSIAEIGLYSFGWWILFLSILSARLVVSRILYRVGVPATACVFCFSHVSPQRTAFVLLYSPHPHPLRATAQRLGKAANAKSCSMHFEFVWSTFSARWNGGGSPLLHFHLFRFCS